MLDFDRVVVLVPCPRCEFPNEVSMRETRFGLTIPCRGCKRSIQLHQKDGTFDQGKKELERALHEIFEDITINIRL